MVSEIPPYRNYRLFLNELKWRPFINVVERSQAQVFVMENVPQLLESPEHQETIATAELLGLKLAWGKLCAADFGVPRVRWRAFIIGYCFANPTSVFPPQQTHCKLDT